MSRQRVGLIGASGETGRSILKGLLEAGTFDIIALTRPASMNKPVNVALKDRGVELRQLDLKGSYDSVVAAIKDVDILVSAIGPFDLLDQIPLAKAAKEVGVKRFIPDNWGTVMPVGIHQIRDIKEVVLNEVKRIHLPYTVVDVGWWYQGGFPALPSGKIDYAIAIPGQRIPGDGNQVSAYTDLRDIGRYVARIIDDDRTLNQMVLVYNELWSRHQVYDTLEKLSGEQIPREYDSLEVLQQRVVDADVKLKDTPNDFSLFVQKVGSQYMISMGIRGDNTPEYAKYLGFLTSKELYPELEYTKFEDYLQEVLGGKAVGVYEEKKKEIAAAMKKNHE